MPVPHAADLFVPIPETLQAAAVATGNGTAISLIGFQSLTVVVTIATTATVTFEGSYDGGTTYVTIGLKLVTAGTYATAPTATGTYVMPADFPPFTHFRARISAWTAGAVDVKTLKARVSS